MAEEYVVQMKNIEKVLYLSVVFAILKRYQGFVLLRRTT